MLKMNVDGVELQFTRNQFRARNLAAFQKFVAPAWAGKPCLYLEIGVFEAQSLVWMLNNILTHPDARAVGIDPWLMTLKTTTEQMGAVMQRAVFNTAQWRMTTPAKLQLVRANSAEILRRMIRDNCYLEDRGLEHYGVRPGTVDLALIDGCHNALGVLDDCRLVLQLMRPGGWMMLDDVEGQGFNHRQDHVKQGVNMFLAEAVNRVQLVWKDRYMECYQVKSSKEITDARS